MIVIILRTLTGHRRTSKCFLRLGSSVDLLGFVKLFAMRSSVFSCIRSALLHCHDEWIQSCFPFFLTPFHRMQVVVDLCVKICMTDPIILCICCLCSPNLTTTKRCQHWHT